MSINLPRSMPFSRFARLLVWMLPLFIGSSLRAASQHWAYLPLQRPVLPAVQDAAWGRTAIDAFVLSKLEETQLKPAPPAEKRTLLRRLYLDLIGLPPSPDEMAAFLADSSPDAYERTVDELLNSPRYGERWARLWMDVVHFAETHGHDQDRIRTNAWPYRDYLVQSFNQDKPYARFVQEQIAGDVLEPDDPQATIALGMVAAGPWDESSLRDIREDTLDRQIGRYLDRDDMVTTVMQTFTSTTVQCARCHDHKFDPISQQDYYSLQAVFAGVDRANRIYDVDPIVHHRRQELLHSLARIKKGDRDFLLGEMAAAEVERAQRELRSKATAWVLAEPIGADSLEGSVLTIEKDGSVRASGPRPERDTYRLKVRCGSGPWTALRLEVMRDEVLPKGGPGRQDNGNLHLSEVEAYVVKGVDRERIELRHSSADFNQEGWTIEHALDGSENTAWGIYPRVGETHTAVMEFKKDLVGSDELEVVLKQLHGGGHLIGRARLSLTARARPVRAAPIPPDIERQLAIVPAQRTEEGRMALAAYFLKATIDRELEGLPSPSFVYAVAADFIPDGSHKPAGAPRLVQVLARGNILTPTGAASPGSLSCLPTLPSRFSLDHPNQEETRRAALARWLTSRENPLVWRSIVNRVWLWHFGRGLVDTPNDFGKLGSPPSHPQLLDWLAIWFCDEAHGSLKQLHRLIVTSSAWRQACQSESERGSQIDADNRYLWRMNRRRLDAEQVRDSVLAVAARLDLRMGGPSDQQFGLEPGIHVTPKVDYAAFNVDEGRRRSIYRFLFRTLPDPFMDALDCPSGDELTPMRNASVTVQQALALWNDAFMIRATQHLAERLQRETAIHSSDTERMEQAVRLAFDLVLGRPADAEELKEFSDYAKDYGLANCCRLFFNSNEFVFVD